MPPDQVCQHILDQLHLTDPHNPDAEDDIALLVVTTSPAN
jgi:hypothetical protein